MRPNALKANRTLTPLETAELLLLPLEEPLGVGVGVVGVEVEFEGVAVGVEPVKVTPYTESNKVQKTMDKLSTHHSAAHLDSSSN